VVVLSREEFDALEFDAAYTGDHRSAAERMTAMATTGIQSESMPRAEAFIRAGEQWLLADNPSAAANDFLMAIADGGPVDVDPQVPLCRAMFQLGNRDEAYALISKLKSEGGIDPRACDMLAETLAEQLDLKGALEWATTGVELMLADARTPRQDTAAETYPALNDLLRLRYRIRNDLRLPEDEYDRMLSA
jgi:hypothetical protein